MKTESIISYLETFKGTKEEVLELTINRFNIVGEIAEVDLIDLLNFPNLESLILINLTLSDKEIMVLTKLNNLTKLNLINCEIICSYIPTELLKIKTLVLDNSNFEEYINNSLFVNLESFIDLVKCKNIITNTLKIDKSDINILDFNLNPIKHLIISEKQYKDNLGLLNNLKIKLTVKANDYDKVVYENEKN